MNSELRKDCPMRHENGNCQPAGGFCTAVNDPICEALHNAYDTGYRAAALRAQQEAKKNEPLTLDELRQIEAGEPIYHASLQGLSSNWIVVREHDIKVFKSEHTAQRYGKTWLAYRREPKEG